MQFNLAILFYKNKVLFKDNKKLSNRTFIFIKSQKNHYNFIEFIIEYHLKYSFFVFSFTEKSDLSLKLIWKKRWIKDEK